MAHYTFKPIYPLGAGAAGTGVATNNRCNFAYPGMPYEVNVSAIGGTYPYLYEFEGDVPAGMEIGAYTGLLTWPNPTADATVTVRITDMDGASETTSWSIDVTTTGWRWLDASVGSSGNGVLVADGGTGAWKTLADAYSGGAANIRLIWREGTYTPAGISTSSNTGTPLANGSEFIQWNQSSKGVCWVAYPGETPTLDYEYTGDGYPFDGASESKPRIVMQGDSIYMDGITFYRSMIMALQFEVRTSSYGVQLRNCTFDTHGPGHDGTNASCCMWESYVTGSLYDIVIGCTFTNISYGTGNCALKVYGVRDMLVANNTFGSMTTGAEGILALKNSKLFGVTVRGNSFDGADTAIGGNMHDITAETKFNAEICFNNVRSTSTNVSRGCITLGAAKTSDLGHVKVWRNTFRGQITIQNVVTDDGPYEFFNNVIVNPDGAQTPWNYVVDTSITDSSRVTIVTTMPASGTGNVAGAAADGILDANGLLQGSYRTAYLGDWGHEITEYPESGAPVIGPGVLVAVF